MESIADRDIADALLSPKQIKKIGISIKAAQIAKEHCAYNIAVLGLCELIWTLSGQVKLSI